MEAILEIAGYSRWFTTDFLMCPYYQQKNLCRSIYTVSVAACYASGFSLPTSIVLPILIFEIFVRLALVCHFIVIIVINRKIKQGYHLV
jgi:hypothetical protein